MKWYHKPVTQNPWLYIIPSVATLINFCGEIDGDQEIEFGYLFFSFILIFIITGGVIFYYKSKYSGREHDIKVYDQIDKKLSILINQHIETLVTLRSQLVYKDPFGQEVVKDWYEKGIKYFIDTQLRPSFTSFDEWQINFRMKEIVELIDKEVKKESKKKRKKIDFKDDMDGIEYEVFCKGILEKHGWKVTLTKKTGDQGVDLIAEKNSIKIALQCKKYNRPVGNKAVQEVYTGKQFYDLKYGGVVSNRSFTDSAKKLASKNGIKLLHHNDLAKIDIMMNK